MYELLATIAILALTVATMEQFGFGSRDPIVWGNFARHYSDALYVVRAEARMRSKQERHAGMYGSGPIPWEKLRHNTDTPLFAGARDPKRDSLVGADFSKLEARISGALERSAKIDKAFNEQIHGKAIQGRHSITVQTPKAHPNETAAEAIERLTADSSTGRNSTSTGRRFPLEHGAPYEDYWPTSQSVEQLIKDGFLVDPKTPPILNGFFDTKLGEPWTPPYTDNWSNRLEVKPAAEAYENLMTLKERVQRNGYKNSILEEIHKAIKRTTEVIGTHQARIVLDPVGTIKLREELTDAIAQGVHPFGVVMGNGKDGLICIIDRIPVYELGVGGGVM